MTDNLKPITDKMKDLFIMERKKYIIQNEDGSYNWLAVSKDNKVKNFNDYMLELHLRGRRTYGIFSGAVFSKFISFDIDTPNHGVVHSIYNELNKIGIDSKFIYTSWSGSKGYHTDIYFSKPILNSKVTKLYNYIIFKLSLQFADIDINKKVELRPSPTQGLKLPLGVNRKNKNSNSNICWYVSIHNSLKPIKNLEYILEIEQIDGNTITGIIDKLPLTQLIQKSTKTVHNSKNVQQSDANLEINHKNNTIHSLELLDKIGLTKKGTRNASLCKLAIYYKALGATKDQCRNKLILWMNKQDVQYYETPLETCYEEIERIIYGVYSKNIPLKVGKTKIEISRNELLTLHHYGKAARNTLHFLFIHSKRYGDENGEFFMTYSQLMEAGDYSKTTAINHVKKLEEVGAVEVTRSPLYLDNNKPRNLPNKYKLNLNIGLIDDERNKTVMKSVKSPSEYNRIGEDAMLELFPNFEWFRMDRLLKNLLT